MFIPAGHVVLHEDLANQLAAAPDAGLGEDRLEMVLDGVRRQGEGVCHIPRGEPLHAQPCQLGLSLGQSVGERDERGDGGRGSRLDDDRGACIRSARQPGAIQQQPRAGPGAYSGPRADLQRVLGRSRWCGPLRRQLGRSWIPPGYGAAELRQSGRSIARRRARVTRGCRPRRRR